MAYIDAMNDPLCLMSPDMRRSSSQGCFPCVNSWREQSRCFDGFNTGLWREGGYEGALERVRKATVCREGVDITSTYIKLEKAAARGPPRHLIFLDKRYTVSLIVWFMFHWLVSL